jgi:predicted permease
MMRRLRATALRLTTVFRRSKVDDDLTAELESHLQLHVDDNLRAGMTPAEARRQAIIALGGVEQAKEQYRDRRGFPALEALMQDVRFGGRMLRRQPTFTAVAVLTLAIGFGPPIAIFALANWTVLRPVPGIPDSGNVSYYMHGTPSPRGGTTVGRVSYLNFRDMTPRLQKVKVTATQGLNNATVGGNGRQERYMSGQFVSANYFDVLGVRMQAGRAFGPADDDPGNPAMVAIISDALWASLFDRAPGAVGKTIAVNGHGVTVVGIAARGFQGARRFEMAELWLPGVTEPVVRALRGRSADDRATGGYYQFYGRLMPGATWAQADTELALAAKWLIEAYPAENERLKTMAFGNQGRIDALGREQMALLMAVMFGTSMLVLVIASSNVASLMLMRGIGRRDEVAVRKALGAGRWRILRQHLTEAALLWLLGGLGGALIVWGVIKTGVTTRLTLLRVPDLQVPFDWQVVGFALALALGVGLVFSILPAWRTTGVPPGVTVQAAGTTATRRFRTGPVLTVVQLSASLALVIGALMLGATLRNLLAVDLGFEPDNVTVVRVQPAVGLSAAAGYAYLTEFRQRLAARPGLSSVVMADGAPFAAGSNAFLRVRRSGSDAFIETHTLQVLSPEYFAALRIRLLRGRSFIPAEIPTPAGGEVPAVVLSASLARQLFGSIDVVGRTVEIPVYQQAPKTYPIVGIAADVRYASLTDEPLRTLYNPVALGGVFQRGVTMIAVAKTSAPVLPDIESVAKSLGSAVPRGAMTLNEAVARIRGEWDVLTWLMTALAVIASIVASVGVYGVVAFTAASRRTEYSIRMALGASTGVVRRQVIRGAAIMAAAGVLFGLGGAFGLMQVLRTRLVGVSPTDPAIWGTAAIILVALVALASLIPARQATRLRLAETLRAI